MSNDTEDKEFFDRADEIINLANTQCDNFAIGKVSSSLDLEELKKDKTEAIKYFKEQYEKVFVENFDEYIRNYEKNIEEQRNS